MNFPPELFLHIIHQIDQPKDLLSLALANRIFCSTIIPDHMDYRQIWCEVDKDEVWNHLLEQRSRCQAVRTLIVDNSEKRYIPRRCYQKNNTITPPPDLSLASSPPPPSSGLLSQQKFCEALSRMSNLKTLKCALSDEDIAKRVVNGINRSGCVLDQLEVVVGRSEDQELDETPFKFEIMSPHLYSLSKFTVYTQIFAKIDAKSMLHTLSNMPNLTYLKLICPTLSLPQLLTIGRWPKLKALTLQLSDLKENAEIDDRTYAMNLRTFFARHPRLESLDFYGTLVPGCMSNTKGFLLPRLTTFRNDYYKVFPVGTILPITISRNLTHLTILVAPRRLNLKPGSLVALKTCNLQCDKDISILEDFVKAAPNVQKLCLYYNRFHLSLPDVLRCLKPLNKLTCLLGPLNNISLSEQQGAALLPELYKFPSLSYIDVKVGNERRCVCLLPNHLRKTMDYEVLSLSEKRPDEFLGWGDFF